MKKLLILLLAALLLTGCGGKRQTVPEYVLTYAENQPENYPTTLGAKYFAQLVEERTGGKVLIDVVTDARMGSQQEVLDQMAFGGIDFARVSVSSLSDELPVLNVLQLPFLYEDADHMWRILDGEIGRDFLEVFREAGLVGLSWYESGTRSFYATTPIQRAEDLRGRTIRVQDSQMMKDMITLLGATPKVFSYSDVYAAFETGQIDCAENSWVSYESQLHNQVAPYYTQDEHTRVPEIQLVSALTWEKLSEEYRQIITECARESAIYQRSLWTQWEEQAKKRSIDRGVRQIFLRDEEYQQLQEMMEPLYEKYCGDYRDLITAIQNG